MITDQLAKYYATIAQQYERVYDKPERQEDLEVLRDKVADVLEGHTVLELACGTGYWTEVSPTRPSRCWQPTSTMKCWRWPRPVACPGT